MSLLNSAKNFALKNKDKVAAGVEKATDVIDKKTGGKHADKLRKLDEAAAKFAGKPAPTATTPEPTPPQPTPAQPTPPQPTPPQPTPPQPTPAAGEPPTPEPG